jgi:hypothetical protein
VLCVSARGIFVNTPTTVSALPLLAEIALAGFVFGGLLILLLPSVVTFDRLVRCTVLSANTSNSIITL